jgi:hypothetical protein
VPRIAALLRRYPQRLPSRILSSHEASESHLLADPKFIAVRYEFEPLNTGRILLCVAGQ